MPTTDVYNTNGRKLSKVTLPKEVFGVEANDSLVAQAVKVYLANQRQTPAQTKRRGEIAFSKRKIWRQKGTGRARHAQRSAPIFVKGGKAHGPTGEQNFKLALNKKMRQKALTSALSTKLKNDQLIVLQGLDKISGKTKELSAALKKFQDKKKQLKITIVLPEVWKNTLLAGRNIPYLHFLQAKQLNTFEVLNGGMLVFTKESLDVLKKNLKGKQ